MPSPQFGVSRRQFVKAGAGGLALSAVSARRVLGANDRVGVGFIGFGMIGKRHVLDFQAQSDVSCVGVSDAHRGRREAGCALLGAGARNYDDFRRPLDDPDVDAVVVSTPDHWHALMTMLACGAGKDVYVEKPLSLFVREGAWMQQVAARTQRIIQVGTQQRSGAHYQQARELIRAGAIGQVHSVRAVARRNITPGFGAPPDGPPPEELDWGAFLGPAPERPYHAGRGIYHFRWCWDTSGGQMTNLGQHSLDIIDWVLGGRLASVASYGGRFVLQDRGETPDTQDALFKFEAPAELVAAGACTSTYTVSWSHREACEGPRPSYPLEFCGTKGILGISRKGFALTPDRRIPPEDRIPRFSGDHPVGGPQPMGAARQTSDTGEATASQDAVFWTQPVVNTSGSESEQFTGHVRNFLDCVRTRTTPRSDIASGHRVSTTCHLANLSLQLGRALTWDAGREEIVGDAEANERLIRPYRAPWDGVLAGLGVS